MTTSPAEKSASTLIDERIHQLNDWRGRTLARVRKLIRQTEPNIEEEWKWRGVPVWSNHGIVCTGEVYNQTVKLTFANGASLPDPAGLFNSSLEGKVRRAIDLRENGSLDEHAFLELIRAAIALNIAKTARMPKSS